MALTKHQRDVAVNVIMSLSENDFTLLSGLAGTGKSYTVAELMHELGKKYSIALTSTTHQACSVLNAEMKPGGIEATTINSFLKMKPVKDSAEFILRTKDYNMIEQVDLLIIDEFSMLTKQVIDTLKHYMSNYNSKLKVLLVGDATQLILEPEAIRELNITDSTFYLIEPMRAHSDSSIAKYCSEASDAIRKSEKPPAIDFGNINDIIKYSDHVEFISEWKKSAKANADMKILCFTNAKVKSYNKHIKEDFYNQKEEYAKGNFIIMRNPVTVKDEFGKDVLIANNTRLKIKKVTKVDMTINGSKDSEEVYEIFSEEYHGSFYIPKSKASLNRLLAPFLDSKDWKSFYKIKDRFAIAHHADAGTVHSSQGSSYDEVFIDASDIMTAQSFKNRLAYVSITRARKKVHIFLGEERKWNAFSDKKQEMAVFLKKELS